MGVANFVRQVYTMHFSIKCQDCSVVPSHERRRKCASMRVLEKGGEKRKGREEGTQGRACLSVFYCYLDS